MNLLRNINKKDFVSGVGITLGAFLAQFFLQTLFRFTQPIGAILTYGTILSLLIVGIFILKNNRSIALGIISTWILFFLLPATFVLILGFTGNLMK